MKNVVYKYKNRKLYSVKNHGYVSMSDVLSMVANGEQVSVINKSNGEDITKRTLLTALMDSKEFHDGIDLDQLVELAQGLKEALNQSGEQSDLESQLLS